MERVTIMLKDILDTLVLYHEAGTKIGAAFHNGLLIKPIKLLRVMILKSSCAKIQNIFVLCKFSLKKSPPMRAVGNLKVDESMKKT